MKDAHTGSVCAVQRTDGALRLNVHLHVLCLDGVYVRDRESGALVFEELGTPSQAEVLDVARRTAERIDRLLRESGRSLEREADQAVPELLLDEPGLASCYAAAAEGISVSGDRAGRPQLRLVFGTGRVRESSAPAASEPVAEHRGVNVHARQRVDGRDRKQLERLCRYVTRPPVAQDRLERLADGQLELRLKHAWRDGTCAVLLEPDDLMVLWSRRCPLHAGTCCATSGSSRATRACAEKWCRARPLIQLPPRRRLLQAICFASSDALSPVLDQVLGENPDVAARYRGGNTGVLGALVGMVMKKTGGRANAKLVSELLKQRLG